MEFGLVLKNTTIQAFFLKKMTTQSDRDFRITANILDPFGIGSDPTACEDHIAIRFLSPELRKYYTKPYDPIYTMSTDNDNDEDVEYSNFLLKKFLNMDLYDNFTTQSKVYENFSKNPAITLETILNHNKRNWSWNSIEKNTSITWDTIQQNRHLRTWSMENFSSNPNLTWDIVREFENELWSFSALSANPNITCDIIEDFPQFDWNFKLMHENPNLTQEFIENNIDKPFDFNGLSSHRNVTMDLFEQHQHKEWNVIDLGNNAAIPWEDIMSSEAFLVLKDIHMYNFNPNMPWDYFYKINSHFKLNSTFSMVSQNPHFTLENITNTEDPEKKIFGKFDIIEYMRNKNIQNWDLVDYAIARSCNGPVKENPQFDRFLSRCLDKGNVKVFNRNEKPITTLFIDKFTMSSCPETTFVEIEKYSTTKYNNPGTWYTCLARNPMPKYKELFMNATTP